jgi:serine/threonine protein kinase
MELFMMNVRFAGLKFPDMSRPETLQKKYMGKLSKRAMSIMKSLLLMEPSDRPSAEECLSHNYFESMDKKYGLNSSNTEPVTAAAPAQAVLVNKGSKGSAKELQQGQAGSEEKTHTYTNESNTNSSEQAAVPAIAPAKYTAEDTHKQQPSGYNTNTTEGKAKGEYDETDYKAPGK